MFGLFKVFLKWRLVSLLFRHKHYTCPTAPTSGIYWMHDKWKCWYLEHVCANFYHTLAMSRKSRDFCDCSCPAVVCAMLPWITGPVQTSVFIIRSIESSVQYKWIILPSLTRSMKYKHFTFSCNSKLPTKQHIQWLFTMDTYCQ